MYIIAPIVLLCSGNEIINNIFLHQKSFRMKKVQKQASKNKISKSWDEVFNRVYSRPCPISVLRSYSKNHIRSNEYMKMEINIIYNQKKFKLIDVKEDTDKLEPKQIVDLVMRELNIRPYFEKQLTHIQNKLQSLKFKQEEQI